MKAIITTKNTTQKPFPKLMISDDGRVVYFQKPKTGVLIYEPNVTELQWDYDNSWIMECFDDFEGTIILSN